MPATMSPETSPGVTQLVKKVSSSKGFIVVASVDDCESVTEVFAAANTAVAVALADDIIML
ncbi:hypothetical protein IWW48_006199, partial [Coemansia sp. RSA 1200]